MSRNWNWTGFTFARERTYRLDAILRQPRPYSLGRDVVNNNVVACLRVLLALRQFRDLPGFDRDVSQLLGWNRNQVFHLQSLLFRGRERFLARHGRRTALPPTRLTALVDELRSQPRFSWQITATRLEYYHRCLEAMRTILASVPNTILDLTPTTTSSPALPRPPRPDWFQPRPRGTRQEGLALRSAIERSLGMGALEGSLFELPLRPGGHGIPQPPPQPQPQPQSRPQQTAAALFASGPLFSLPIRQRE